MHDIFSKAQEGINTILTFLVLGGILSLGAMLTTRHRLKDSDLSEDAKRYAERAAAIAVFSVIGVIMLIVLNK